jgi:DNA-binding LytR/AlgR family response regulator
VQQFRSPSDIFIPLKDEKGMLRVTIKCSDLLFIEANDNYVNVHYLDNNKEKKLIIRNTLKRYENLLKDYPVYRVHRKFSVNIKNVKMLLKSTKGYELIINSEQGQVIPVSGSYQKRIIAIMSSLTNR